MSVLHGRCERGKQGADMEWTWLTRHGRGADGVDKRTRAEEALRRRSSGRVNERKGERGRKRRGQAIGQIDGQIGGLGGQGWKRCGRVDGQIGGLEDVQTRGWAGGFKRRSHLAPHFTLLRPVCLPCQRASVQGA